MKFSENWLREWVSPKASTQELSHQLTMAGLEVDAIESVAPALDKVVVGKVEALNPHPDADKLQICTVNIGEKERLSIICGASNVRENGCFPVATIGAVLPGGLKIKKAKLRGVESFGMLCSMKELGLAEQANGLLELEDNAPIGTNISDYLNLVDNTIELGLTPNRGDCLSIAGIAREVGVIYKEAVSTPKVSAIKASIKDTFNVQVKAASECPRYVGRVMRDINPTAETPMWMKEKLRRCGLRSLSPVVDVTNYILLELGQPMHAFDLDKLKGKITVRLSNEGEKIALLDGSEVEVDGDTLLITDDNGPLALAGVMGGSASAVSDSTQHIFLESAYFDPVKIAGKARSYGMHTDSSHRFERGVDAGLQATAIERATQLLIDIVGGKAGPITEVKDKKTLPKNKTVELRHARIFKVLGVSMEPDGVCDILTRLGMQVKSKQASYTVEVPGFRFDIEKEIDLIEELARIHGYDNIQAVRPFIETEIPASSESRIDTNEFRRVLIDRQYQEAITYSFVDPEMQQLLHPEARTLELKNPISADMSTMRTSLWPGLLQAAAYNLNRQQSQIRLFETGLRFRYENDQLIQEPMLSGVLCGTNIAEQWAEKQRPLDFFDVKNDIEALFGLTGSIDQLVFKKGEISCLHPGQCAEITLNGSQQAETNLGWIGALHPKLQQKLDLSQQIFIFELRLSVLQDRCIPKFSEVSKYPAIRRDLALLVDENISIQQVSDCIKGCAEDDVKYFQLFDVYTGKGIDSGRKSLAYSLTLQNDTRTLKDEEVDSVVTRILSELQIKLDATLRE